MLSIYKASAGSGKTFTLAYEYIKMLLGRKDESGKYSLGSKHQRNNHRHILAITFTNKATDEMKSRIVAELATLAGIEKGRSPYLDMLVDEFGCSKQQLCEAARNALQELLFDYGSFGISTIDSFFQSILRTFAREAELIGNYEVEIDTDGPVALSVAELFRSLSYRHDDKATRRTIHWLTNFLTARVREKKSVNLFNTSSELHSSLLGFIKGLMNEEFALHAAEFADYFSDSARIDNLVKSLSVNMRDILGRIAEKGTTIKSLAETIDNISTNNRKWIEGSAVISASTVGASIFSGATIRKAAADPETILTGAKARKQANMPLAEEISRFAAELLEEISKYYFFREIGVNIHFLGIFGDVLKQLESYRQDNNMLLLSDTNGLLHDIIGDDDAPFVYERMGVWYHHYLIDEFQDTSKMQWLNIRPLLSESMAVDNDSLIIGDEKQCIYRFRSSDPNLLKEEVETDFVSSKVSVKGNTPGANTNWRSSATVVKFNNDLFTAAASLTGNDEIYSNAVQEISPAHSNHAGFVALACISASNNETYNNVALYRMSTEIRRQIESGYSPGDIVVLCRKKAQASLVISHLIALQESDPQFPRFRIVSDDALLVSSAPSVRLIMSILRSVALSSVTSSSKMVDGVLRNDSHTLSQASLTILLNEFEKAQSMGMTPSAALSQAVKSVEIMLDNPEIDVNRQVADELDMSRCSNLIEMVDRIIQRFIPEATLEVESMYIAALRDMVVDFSARGSADVRSFCNWWDTKGRKNKVATSPDSQSLKVMTIHKSKGLEFKCVHVPFATWKTNDFKSPEWFDTSGIEDIPREYLPPMLPIKPAPVLEGTPFGAQYRKRVAELLLDELNVTYVVFTRAIDELIVTYREASDASISGLLCECASRMMRYIPAESQLNAFNLPEDSGLVGDLSMISGKPTTAIKESESKNSGSKALPAVFGETVGALSSESARGINVLAGMELPRPKDEARLRGIMYHDVLSHVRNLSDVSKAVRRCVSRGLVPRDAADEIETGLTGLLSREDVYPWFSGYRKVLIERPVSTGRPAAHGNFERRRPDRVVWTSDGHIDVIDYKTGDTDPTKYYSQIRRYLYMLKSMGLKNLRGYIWNLDSGKIYRVPPKKG